MNRSIFQAALLLAATIAASSSSAEDWELTGFVGLDTQAFWLDGRYQSQDTGLNPSLLLQPEFYWRSDSGRQRVSVVGFARADSTDDERSHVDLREAYWGLEGDGWDLTAGVGKVFWGVTESRHLVDVINQTDLVESIDEESKLGQPLVNLNLQRDYGRFGLFVMPYFRERTYPGVDGRFRAPLIVDSDNPIYESSDKENHVDLALRYSHYIGDVDIGAHAFEGTSREARFVVAPEGDRLLPVYDQMTQFGIDVQYTAEAWLWKLEAIARDTRVDSFMAAVAGFEYTFYGVNESSADVGLLLEYLYDDRNSLSPLTASDNDLFVGTRLALNDADDTSVLAGIAVDLDTQELFLNIEAERRFGDKLSAELQLRTFMNAGHGDTLFAIEQDDYLQLRLSWYY
ncbi:MAG: hypothetical protein ACR2RD_17430 [Woeseiaceae bacterium]